MLCKLEVPRGNGEDAVTKDEEVEGEKEGKEKEEEKCGATEEKEEKCGEKDEKVEGEKEGKEKEEKEEKKSHLPGTVILGVRLRAKKK